MTEELRIGFAGMTHLAICSAFAAAAKGFHCVGFDPDAAIVADLREHRFPIFEPGLNELAAANSKRVTLTDRAEELGAVDVCFVAPDVPTDADGRSDLAPIRRLIETVGGRLSADATMVVLSQVPPGFTRSLGRPARRRFCQVETLIFGQAVERALNPERFMVGCADPADALPPAYRRFLAAFGCPVLPMRYESAELAKIAINMFLVSSVTTTNTIAELCERIGADWQEIVPALRLDRRIGQHAYLAPGLGIGGGNLERDLVTFSEIGRREGTDTDVVSAWVHNSRRRRTWARQVLEREMPAGIAAPVVAVLGLAYKQDTAFTRNSAGLALVQDLPAGWTVRVFDPAVKADMAWRAAGLEQGSDPQQTCRGADVVAIMTPWAQFRALDLAVLAHDMRGKLVIDPYGILDAAACRGAGLAHFQLGRG